MLIQKINQKFVKFLSSLDSSAKPICVKSAATTIISQSDSSSCGVCVCIAADAICSVNSHSKVKDTNVDDFRSWIIYNMVNNGAACHFIIKNYFEIVRNDDSIDTSSEDIDTCNKRVVKRRKQSLLPVATVKTRKEEKKEKPNLNYFVINDAKEKWNAVSPKLLQELLNKIIYLVNLSLTQAEKVNFGYRHALYLQGKTRTLQKTFFFDYEYFQIKSEFALNLSMYIANNICLQRIYETINCESGFVSARRRSALFDFDNRVVKHSSDLCLYLKETACNEYMRLVVDIECVVYYVMLQHGLTYEKASHGLGITSFLCKGKTTLTGDMG